ncbi:hypothetical protein C8Q75DRAFT_590651 [Abortiporus biennis]|nr:hypothetical protein C8Q75DRAFT_590651 [Abortiporus biennis]
MVKIDNSGHFTLNHGQMLPIEIWERIIDMVAEQPDRFHPSSPGRTYTLRSCTLTCKSWSHRSLYHLNVVVTLTSGLSVSRLLSRFHPSPRSSHEFIPHYNNTSPKVISIIPTNESLPDHNQKQDYWVSSTPIRVNSILPVLEELVLKGFNLAHAHTTLIPALSLARSLRILVLSKVIFTSNNQLNRLIYSFDKLVRLRLFDVHLQPRRYPIDHNPFPHHLHHFETIRMVKKRNKTFDTIDILPFDRTEDLLNVFSVIRPMACFLLRLRIDDIWLEETSGPRGSEGFQFLQDFLKMCHSLEELTFVEVEKSRILASRTGYEIVKQTECRTVDLSPCSKLRRLQICSLIEDSFIALAPLVFQLVKTISSMDFTSVRFILALSGTEKLLCVPWSILDNVVAGPTTSDDVRFGGLRTVHVIPGTLNYIVGASDEGSISTSEEFLPALIFVTRERMPFCSSRNLLRFNA